MLDIDEGHPTPGINTCQADNLQAVVSTVATSESEHVCGVDKGSGNQFRHDAS